MVLFFNRAKATTVHIDPLESHVFVQMYFRIMILKTESLKPMQQNLETFLGRYLQFALTGANLREIG